MRMLRPSPGEIADRQTVLQLKARFGEEKGLDVHHFTDENELLQLHLEKNWFPDLPTDLGEDYDKLFDELSELNLQVWKVMDSAHVLVKAPDWAQAAANIRAAELLYEIISLNDKRADIVNQINSLFKVRVQEKIYA